MIGILFVLWWLAAIEEHECKRPVVADTYECRLWAEEQKRGQ